MRLPFSYNNVVSFNHQLEDWYLCWIASTCWLFVFCSSFLNWTCQGLARSCFSSNMFSLSLKVWFLYTLLQFSSLFETGFFTFLTPLKAVVEALWWSDRQRSRRRSCGPGFDSRRSTNVILLRLIFQWNTIIGRRAQLSLLISVSFIFLHNLLRKRRYLSFLLLLFLLNLWWVVQS